MQLPRSSLYRRALRVCSMSHSRTNTSGYVLHNRRCRNPHDLAFTDLDVRPGRSCIAGSNTGPEPGSNSASTESKLFVVVRLKSAPFTLRRSRHMGSGTEADATRGGVRRQKRGCRHWFWLCGLLYGILLLIYHTNDANILTQRAANVL